MRLQTDPLEQAMMGREPGAAPFEAGRVSTAAAHVTTPVSIFDRQSATSKRAIGTTVPRMTRQPHAAVATDTATDSAPGARLRPLVPAIRQPLAVNPFVGPNGTVDLHTVLNARLDNIPMRGAGGDSSRNHKSHFGNRATSVEPRTTAGLLPLEPISGAAAA